MRFIASPLLIIAAVVQLLLGGLVIFGAVEARDEARAEAGDLSSVSGDLVSEEELAAMRADGEKKAGRTGKFAHVLGMVTMALSLLQLVTGVLALLRRALPFVLIAGGLTLACLLAVLLLESGGNTVAMAMGLLAVGLIAVGLDYRSVRAAAVRRQAA